MVSKPTLKEMAKHAKSIKEIMESEGWVYQSRPKCDVRTMEAFKAMGAIYSWLTENNIKYDVILDEWHRVYFKFDSDNDETAFRLKWV